MCVKAAAALHDMEESRSVSQKSTSATESSSSYISYASYFADSSDNQASSLRRCDKLADWIPDPPPPNPARLLDDEFRTDSALSRSEARSASLARRENPKRAPSLYDLETASVFSERFHNLKFDYNYRVHTKGLGHLYAICDAVPYLVGPRLYLRAINRFGVHPLPLEAFQDRNGRVVLDPDRLSLLDKVVLAMLYLLCTPADQRPAEAVDWFAGMSIEQDRILVYKDVGFGREPKKTAMDIYDFQDMAVAWQRLPNPARVAEDRPDAVTPWRVVAARLRADQIPLRDIDKALYVELVQLNEDELDARITRLATTNELELRKSRISNFSRKLSAPTPYTYVMPQETNPDVMYAKRFSRQHPQGYLLDTTAENDGALVGTTKPRQDAPAVPGETEAKLETLDTQHAKPKAFRKAKRVCMWVLAFASLVGAAVGITLMYHFKRSSHDSRGGS